MGQRANYILIEGDNRTIHYHHWRANCITSDLYLGEKRFIEFVKACRVVEVLLDEHWIEGFVVIDFSKKSLHFWSFEFEKTSVIPFYLNKLQNRWKGWDIRLLYNKMYDLEKVLNINYLNTQEPITFLSPTIDDFINDKVDEYVLATIVIKYNGQLHITKTGEVGVNDIVSFGEEVIDFLLGKPSYKLPSEGDDSIYECIIIDAEKKKIIIDKSEYGLWEQCQNKWPGYTFKMGDYGYIAALHLAGIDTSRLVFSKKKAREIFNSMIKQHEDFDPVGFAKTLLTQQKDVKFNQDFFDTTNPKKNLFERIRAGIGKLIPKH